MTLTVKRAGADEYGTWIKMLVVADPGAGKTRTASTWPDVLYANCEGGMMSVADRSPACVDITAPDQVKELVGLLAQPPAVREQMLKIPVQTVVVDTLDEIARMLIKQRLEDERKESFAMADWGWLGDQLRNIVRAFRNLDMNVIINVHVKSQEDSETGRTYFKPAIQGAMSDELAAYVDLALLMVAKPTTTVVNGKNVRSITRYLQTYPDAQHPWVKDRSGKLPMEFAVNFEDDYERIHKAIYANLPGASSVLSSVAEAAPEAPAEAPKRTTGAAKATAKAAPAEPTLDTVEELKGIAEATAPEPTPEPTPEPEPVVGEGAEQPEPAPEPAAAPEPEAEPEPTPEPEAPAPDAEPEPEVTEPVTPEPEAVAEPATPDRAPWQTCEGCGGEVESKDQADLAFIRHKQHLCRKCFTEKKKAK